MGDDVVVGGELVPYEGDDLTVGVPERRERVRMLDSWRRPVELDDAMSFTYRSMARLLREGQEIRLNAQGALFVWEDRDAVMGRKAEEHADAVREKKRAQLANAFGREAFNRGYFQAMLDTAADLAELERRVVQAALAKDASESQIKMALALGEKLKDRLGGKAVQAIDHQGGGEGGSFADRMAR